MHTPYLREFGRYTYIYIYVYMYIYMHIHTYEYINVYLPAICTHTIVVKLCEHVKKEPTNSEKNMRILQSSQRALED